MEWVMFICGVLGGALVVEYRCANKIHDLKTRHWQEAGRLQKKIFELEAENEEMAETLNNLRVSGG